MKPDYIVRTENLVLGYGRNDVLRDVNIEFRPGEFWALLGRNGVGKTTLIKALLGIFAPRAGRIVFHRDLALKENVGYVPQRARINPTLPSTIREFILLGLVGIRASAAEAEARLQWALAHVGLTALAERDTRSLSGGQFQRALVGRALVRRPRLLFLDEPTTGLDLVSEVELLACLEDLNRGEGLTIALITHDLALAAQHASHAAIFIAGGVTSGPLPSTMTSEALRRAYGVDIAVVHDETGKLSVHLGRVESVA
ncbi:ABC transporter ATP-binding protein [bacterium]|nr:ABC transporter ATP-binding protein [bacterium]